MEQKDDILKIKSYDFALEVVKLTIRLQAERKEYVISRQLLKAGTSIGANIEEGLGGQSKRDFIAKFSISYKELRESYYWIRILKDTGLITAQEFSAIESKLCEIQRILVKIIKTAKENEKRRNL